MLDPEERGRNIRILVVAREQESLGRTAFQAVENLCFHCLCPFRSPCVCVCVCVCLCVCTYIIYMYIYIHTHKRMFKVDRDIDRDIDRVIDRWTGRCRFRG